MKAIKKLSRHAIGATALYVSIMFLVISVALRYTETGFIFIWASLFLDIFAGYELDVFKGLNDEKVSQ